MVEFCRICGTHKNLEKHHLKPLSEGGLDTPENTVFLCKECHKQLGEKGRSESKIRGRNLSNIGTFYLGEPYKRTWQDFRAVCIREGTTASKKLVEFIAEYVQLHDPGNPQQLLKQYADHGRPYIAPDTKFLKCGFHTWLNGQPACMLFGFKVIKPVGINYEKCVPCKRWRVTDKKVSK